MYQIKTEHLPMAHPHHSLKNKPTKWNHFLKEPCPHPEQTLLGGSLTRHITVRLYSRTLASLLYIPVTTTTCLSGGKMCTDWWSEDDMCLFKSQVKKKRLVRSCQRISSTLIILISSGETSLWSKWFHENSIYSRYKQSYGKVWSQDWCLCINNS